jgi:hypothetical protein
MVKKGVKRGYFSKVSTGEIPVFSGPVDFLNRSGPVPVRSGRTGTGLPDRFQLCKGEANGQLPISFGDLSIDSSEGSELKVLVY